jgi:hypothetical protein
MDAARNSKTNDEMSRKTTAHLWVIYFVGFDDATDDAESRVQPYVGRERIETSVDDAEQMSSDAMLAALCRGGRVVAVVGDDEAHAERTRSAIEMEIIRYR